MANLKDYIQLNFLVFIWGFTAILGLFITIPPLEIVFYRTLIASITLALILLITKAPFSIPLPLMLKFFLTGIVIAIHWILFFLSARMSTASICLAGIATSSLWTSLLEPLFSKKKISLFEVSLGLIVVVGTLIIFRFEIRLAEGFILGILSALAQAIFAVINSRFSKIENPYKISFYEMIGAFIGTLLFLLFFTFYIDKGKVNLLPTVTDLLYISVLAIICTVYAFSKSIELMKRISAFAMNLTINLEPIYGMLLAYLFFKDKEKMSTGFYLGSAIILVSVLGYPIGKFLQKRFQT